jgi:hypothetical protein
MTRLYSYTIPNDHGFTPNPFYGILTLTCLLRVCGQRLLGIAQGCKTRIGKGFLFPALLLIAGHCVRVRVKLGSIVSTLRC